MRLEVARTKELDRWIAERHYLGNTPPGAKLRLWVIDQGGRRIGAMMWGRPTARALDGDGLLELTRMYMVDDTEPNAESRALALARKHIRRHLPQIKGLIAYASTGQEHEGTIYAADNWFVSQGTSARRQGGWSTREGRANKDTSQKIRWMRSL